MRCSCAARALPTHIPASERPAYLTAVSLYASYGGRGCAWKENGRAGGSALPLPACMPSLPARCMNAENIARATKHSVLRLPLWARRARLRYYLYAVLSICAYCPSYIFSGRTLCYTAGACSRRRGTCCYSPPAAPYWHDIRPSMARGKPFSSGADAVAPVNGLTALPPCLPHARTWTFAQHAPAGIPSYAGVVRACAAFSRLIFLSFLCVHYI